MGVVNAFGFPWSPTLCCYLCNTSFVMEIGLYNQRLQDHRNFWCPNGHDQHFTSETKEQAEIRELKSRLAAEERNSAYQKSLAETQKRSRVWAEKRAKGANIAAGMAKATLRRTLHRVKHGVCPHCHRTFKQLAAHMKAKHS